MMTRVSKGLFVNAVLGAAVLWATPVSAKDAAPALELARQLNQAFIEVADQVSPSVAVIRVAHTSGFNERDEDPLLDWLPHDFRKQFEERRDKQRKESPPRTSSGEPVYDSQGSGVVIREDGYILTNRHVVDGADKIKVRFADGQEFDATVRGLDSQSDIAVIKVNATALKAAKLGDSSQTRVGEFAIAIGAPFELDYSVTVGHVSAKGRSRIIDDPAADQDFIQTDANINPGNSGGPLVNLYGEVIGINTLIRGLRTGIGFAIPINLAKEIADQLITDGKFLRSWLGVVIRPLKEAPEYGALNSDIRDGVVVTEIRQDGPAAGTDLKPSDVITAVDGHSVTTSQQLKNEIRAKRVGQTLTLDVHRNGRDLKIKVKTDVWPDETTLLASKALSLPEGKGRSLGLTVRSLTKETADQYGVEQVPGVIVTEVERGSVAERRGLRPGDVITEVNHTPVTSPKDFREAVNNSDVKKGVIIILTSRETIRSEVLKDSGD
jgi:serine protease Do